MTERLIDHSVGIEKDKTLVLSIVDNLKIEVHIMNVTTGEEAIEAKIMIIGVTVGIEADKILEET